MQECRSIRSASTTGRPRAISPAGSADPTRPSRRPRATRKRTTKRSAARSKIWIDTRRFSSTRSPPISRLSFRWAEQQPEAFSDRSGKKDIRGAYGLHAREMINWLQQLQHARGKNVVFVGILEKVDRRIQRRDVAAADGRRQDRPRAARHRRQIVTMQLVDFGDGKPVRAFVCTSPNPWGYPAKDRAGRLEQIEEPHLGKLISKLVGPASARPSTFTTRAKAQAK